MNVQVRKMNFVVMLLALLVLAGSGFAAVVIGGDPGEVSPANIDTVPSQPAAPLNVGLFNTGTLDINGGSVVDTSAGVLGFQPASSGTITVDGAGSQWNIHNASGNQTLIGQLGTGVLNITNGGVVNNLSPIGPPIDSYSMESGFGNGSSGTILVDGAGSQLNSDILTVGRGIGSTSNLAIVNGGTVNVNEFNLGQQGTVFMQISPGSALNVAGDAYLGVNGTSGAVIDGGGAMTVGGDLYVGRNPGSDSTVVVTGAGSVIDVTGTTTVENGGSVSVVNGATGNFDDVVVGAGSAFYMDSTSNGTITGDVDVQDDGVMQIDPGANISVTGNYLLANGATLEVGIDTDAGNLPSHIAVDGDATFEAGSRVNVTQTGSGFITASETFDILTATGVVNAPNPVTQQNQIILTDNTPFLDFSWTVVGGNTFRLTATKASNFAPMAYTRNRLSTAMGLDDMGARGTGTARQNQMLGALQFLDVGTFNHALSQMNPEPYIAFGRDLPNRMEAFHRDLGRHLSNLRNGYVDGASGAMASKGLSMDMSLASTEIDPETLAAAIEEQQEQEMRDESLSDEEAATNTDWSVWGQITNNWNRQHSTNDLVGWRNRTWGVISGVDREVGNGLRIGALMGYSRSEFHFNDSRGHLDVDSLRVGPYMGWSTGNLFIEASLTFGYHWNDAKRKVNFPGFSDSNTAKYESWDLSPYGRIGYTFDVAGWKLTPSMAMQYVYYSQEGFSERGGSGATNLKMDRWSQNSLRQIFMFEVSKLFDLEYVKLIPSFMVGYSLEYLDDQNLSYSFVNQTYPMTFWPGTTGGNRALWGVGVTALLSDDLSLFVRYDGSAGSKNQNHSLSSGLRVKF